MELYIAKIINIYFLSGMEIGAFISLAWKNVSYAA